MRSRATFAFALSLSFWLALIGITPANARVEFHPLDDFALSASHSIDRQNQLTLGLGVLAFVGARTFDNDARDSFSHQHRLGNADWIGNEILGTGVPGALLGGGFWIWGAQTENDRLVHAGQAQLEALVATAAVTEAFKITVARERPDQSDRRSFPSGHTSTMFATAQVLEEFYGWRAGAVGYALGAFTAASRMSADRHWLSDTVGGATFGILVGHAVSRAHLDKDSTSVLKARVTPFCTGEASGLLVRADW